MHGKDVLDTLLREHEALRARLREWDAALSQATGSSGPQSQHAINVLRDLCHYFEQTGRNHFRAEETVLYAAAEHKLPRLRGLLVELRLEHDAIRQVFDDFRRELIQVNASGGLGQIAPLGRELIRQLRKHVDREERELNPVILNEFTDEDWRQLRRLFVDSEVA